MIGLLSVLRWETGRGKWLADLLDPAWASVAAFTVSWLL
jgi:hypothetical protein